jgi:hypothetical protein
MIVHPFSFLAAGAELECDPSTLTLTMWNRANFVDAPWVGETSAGTSSAFSWGTGGNTPGTFAINGLNAADFDGTNDRLFNDVKSLADVLTASTWWLGALVRLDTVIAAVESNWYDNDEPIIADSQGGWGLGVSDAGIRAASYDGSFKTTPWVEFDPGAWGWVEAWLTGGTLSCSLNGGTAQTVACGNSSILASSFPRLGANYNAAKFYDGKIADLMISQTVPDAEERACLLDNYLFERYAFTPP